MLLLSDIIFPYYYKQENNSCLDYKCFRIIDLSWTSHFHNITLIQYIALLRINIPEGGPDTPLRLCLSPVTEFVPLWPGCVITWDGPGRLETKLGEEERRVWGDDWTETRLSQCKASEVANSVMQLPKRFSKCWHRSWLRISTQDRKYKEHLFYLPGLMYFQG